jgi:threonyl-tRNA synthetase
MRRRALWSALQQRPPTISNGPDWIAAAVRIPQSLFAPVAPSLRGAGEQQNADEVAVVANCRGNAASFAPIDLLWAAFQQQQQSRQIGESGEVDLKTFEEFRAELRRPIGLSRCVVARVPSPRSDPHTTLGGHGGSALFWDLERPLDVEWVERLHAAQRAQGVRGDDMESAAHASAAAVPVFDFLGMDDPAGRSVAWHSSAHVLGAALESRLRGAAVDGEEVVPLLTDGPATEHGFFYEFDVARRRAAGDHTSPDSMTTVAPQSAAEAISANLTAIRQQARKIAKRAAPFERLALSLDEAREMFGDNPYKLEMLEKLSERDPEVRISAYKSGDFIDLCSGPHAPSTAVASAFQMDNVSTAQYDTSRVPTHANLEDGAHVEVKPETHHTLFRVHACAFPTADMLGAHNDHMRELEQRAHTVIGKQQRLFLLDGRHAPGAAFWLPHGVRILHRLEEFLRGEYRRRGFDEVRTPQMYTPELWKTSGHWSHYRGDMFHVVASDHQPESADPPTGGAVESQDDSSSHSHPPGHAHGKEYMLKPMNCPAHCLLFNSQPRSLAHLPIRIADFGALHRNELSGALHGLTRGIRFHQDDAHIFCSLDQVQAELADCLDFVYHVYTKCLGFPADAVKANLSTRPLDTAETIGTDKQWEGAEAQLRASLEAASLPFSVSEGDGAFYGPKVDVELRDALGRSHQCATIQLDFNLPDRFELNYTDSDGRPQVPVMIHRAVLGSFERMFAILCEHYGGKWPLWLSPRQVRILPIADRHNAHAEAVRRELAEEGYFVSVDDSNDTTQKKILRAQQIQTNFMLVVGDQEVLNGTAGNLRERDGNQLGEISIRDMVDKLRSETAEFE